MASRRSSPLARRSVARARRVSRASTSQLPSSTTLPARPVRSSSAGWRVSKASAQASGRPCSAPRVCRRMAPWGEWLHCAACHCSWAWPGSGPVIRASPAEASSARPVRGCWRSVRASGWASCTAQGPGRAPSRAWAWNSLSCRPQVPAPWCPPWARARNCSCCAPLRTWPSRLACSWGSEPESWARRSCSCRSTAAWPALAGWASVSCGAASSACSVKAPGAPASGGVATRPALCNWRCRPSQPPLQRASRRAWPCRRAPGSSVPRPGRAASQSRVRCGASSCTRASPVPARGPRRPCTWALAPGTVSCRVPSKARAAVSMRRLRPSAWACRACTCSCCSCSTGACQRPSARTWSMRRAWALCVVFSPRRSMWNCTAASLPWRALRRPCTGWRSRVL